MIRAINRYLTAIFVSFMILSSLYAGNSFWWTFSQGGDISSRDEGTTIGQNVIGEVHADSIDGTYGFWHGDNTPVLNVSTSDSIWHIPDPLVYEATASMEAADRFVISNDSNCHINLGLRFVGSMPDILSVGDILGRNTANVRARFVDSETPPVSYNLTNDVVNGTLKWAYGETFGSFGQDVGISDVLYLYMQFVAPFHYTGSSPADFNIMVKFQISTQVNLP